MGLLSVAKVFAKKAATSTVKSTSGGAIVKAKPVKAKGGALTVVKKGASKKKKVDKDVFMKEKKARKRQQELKDRKDKENLLEAADDTPDKKGKKKSKKKPGGFLQKLIDFITIILVGWIVDKLPKVIEWIKNLIGKIKEIVENIKGFFTDIGDFFKKIGKVIGKAWEVISNLKFEDITGLVKKGFSNIKDAFGNIFNKMKDGVKNFLGLSKKKGKKEGDPKTEAGDPPKDVGFKSVVGDMKNTMGKMSDDWDQTTVKMEESINGSEITGSAEDVGGTSKKLDPEKVVDKKKTGSGSDTQKPSAAISGNGGDKKQSPTYKIPFNPGQDSYTGPLEPVSKSSSPKLNKTTVSTASITPNRKSQDIVVIDDDSSSDSPIQSSTGKSSTKIIVVEASVNSVVDKQLLTNLA